MKLIVCYALALLLFTSCYTMRKSAIATTKDKSKTEHSKTIEKITESVNDTLQGEVPLQLTNEPVEFNFGSSATKLKLNVVNGKLRYKATTRVNKKVIEKQQEDNTQQNDIQKKQEEDKKQDWKPPWWLSGVLLLALFVVYKVFSLKFKIITK